MGGAVARLQNRGRLPTLSTGVGTGSSHSISLCPFSLVLRRAAGAEGESAGVEGYETSKGTIRFPLNDPPSAAVVRRLVKARLATGMFR